MTLSIDDVARTGPGLVEVIVTVTNHGASAIKLDHRSFALADAEGERTSAHLFRGGLLARGQVSSFILYFVTPLVGSRPVDLRVDLTNAAGQPISRTYVPLAVSGASVSG